MIVTRVCTASYTYIVFTDKSTKLASVQEANVTATVNGIQRTLHISFVKIRRKIQCPSMGKNQLTMEKYDEAWFLTC